MTVRAMPVKSRLREILLEQNLVRVRAGQQPWKVRELADAAGVSPSVVTGLTTNRATQVRFETLNRLCRVLNCTPGDILVYSPDAPEHV